MSTDQRGSTMTNKHIGLAEQNRKGESMKKILFVCTGNTCRSAMAEALFNDLLDQREERDILVSSAGVYAFENDPASSMAIEVLQNEYGIDITSHRARVLDADDIRNAWLILAMTEDHKRMILEVFPESADKVYTLKDYAEIEDGRANISDPYGGDYDVYKACAYEIETALINVAEKVFDNGD